MNFWDVAHTDSSSQDVLCEGESRDTSYPHCRPCTWRRRLDAQGPANTEGRNENLPSAGTNMIADGVLHASAHALWNACTRTQINPPLHILTSPKIHKPKSTQNSDSKFSFQLKLGKKKSLSLNAVLLNDFKHNHTSMLPKQRCMKVPVIIISG
jgi:hypothetical protein